MFFWASFCILLLTYWLWQKFTSKNNNFPPGPKSLPFFGPFPFMPEEVKKGKKRMQIYMEEEFGPISGFHNTFDSVVFLSNLEDIKEIYKKYEASGRPAEQKPFHELRFGDETGQQRGLLSSTGTEWLEQRRFTMRNLKDLGFGKSTMEDTINDEVEKLVKLLDKVLLGCVKSRATF
jgi:methyl farnesoate epoxidase/farnesoate epoxidase